MSVIELGENALFISDYNVLVTPKLSDVPGGKPLYGVEKNNSRNVSKIIYWGDGNNFPQTVKEEGYKNPIIPRAIMMHINMTAGATIQPVIKDYDDNGNEKLIYVRDAEIADYLRSIEFRRYQLESASDLFWYQNIFPSIIISKNRKYCYLSPNEASFCRWSVQNDYGVCEHVYHNANWPFASPDDAETTRVKAIDPYSYDIVEAVRDDSKEFHFIYPASYPSPGSLFYQTAFWDGIRQSKYLEFLRQIPEVKNQILKNKIKPSYHVQLPMMHWERWFGKTWHEADHQKRKQLKETYLEVLQSLLSNKSTAGGAFVTEYGSSSIDNRVAEKWEINRIEDKTEDGSYNLDNIDGTVQLLCALGIDSSLIGYSSKEAGARNGGSDKIQALNVYIETMQPFKDVILEPLRFKAQFEGWTKRHPGLDFVAKYPNIDRLNGKGTIAQVSTKQSE